jgi:hypothetical protein
MLQPFPSIPVIALNRRLFESYETGDRLNDHIYDLLFELSSDPATTVRARPHYLSVSGRAHRDFAVRRTEVELVLHRFRESAIQAYCSGGEILLGGNLEVVSPIEA